MLCSPEGDADSVKAVQLGTVHESGKVALLGGLASPQAPEPCGAVLKAIPCESLQHQCLIDNRVTQKAHTGTAV